MGMHNCAEPVRVREVACTGIHVPNRLASTSLWRALCGATVQLRNIATHGPLPVFALTMCRAGRRKTQEEADPALVWRDVRTIQHTMWHYVGLARSAKRLERALARPIPPKGGDRRLLPYYTVERRLDWVAP